MNKDQKIWLSVSIISGIIYMSIITISLYNISFMRFRFGIYIFISVYVIMFTSFLMYALTQYISTKEVVSILAKKVRG